MVIWNWLVNPKKSTHTLLLPRSQIPSVFDPTPTYTPELPCWGLNPGPWLDTLGTICLTTSSSILFLLPTPQIAFLANGSPWPGSEVPCELCHSPGVTPHSCPCMLFCRLASKNLYGNHIAHLSFKRGRGSFPMELSLLAVSTHS